MNTILRVLLLWVICVTGANAIELEGNAKYNDALKTDTNHSDVPPVAPQLSSILQGQAQASTYPAQATYGTADLNALDARTEPISNRIPRTSYNSSLSADSSKLLDPTQFRINVPLDQHGQAPVGVMGCQFDPAAARILTIFPGSDMLRLGLFPGDQYLAISGQPVVHNKRWIQDMTRGKPGTYVDITFLHNGRPIEVQLIRKDSRLFVQYEQTYHTENYFSWCAAQTRYW